MKILAIVNRGQRRDFLDLDQILLHGFSLRSVMLDATTRITGLVEMTIARSLAYFDDADRDVPPDGSTAEDWELAKQRIRQTTRGAMLTT